MIVSESGRAIAAHHSVLIFNTLGILGARPVPRHRRTGDDYQGDGELPQPVRDLFDAYRSVTRAAPGRVLSRRAAPRASRCCRCSTSACSRSSCAASPSGSTGRPARKIRDLTPQARRGAGGARRPRVDPLGHLLLQLLGVPVAARQLGDRPAVPDHADPPARRAARRATACSPTSPATRTARSTASSASATSSGRSSCTRSRAEDEYYLAAFLVGAYQETLGDLHNLFGDTHVVHVRLHDEGGWWIEEIVKGDTANKVLEYMEYDVAELYPALARDCERAVREGRMSLAESQALKRFYEGELNGYAYLE